MATLAARRSSGPAIRSISPSSRFNRHYPTTNSSSSSAAAAFTASRSASPTRLNLYNYSSPSLSFSLDRPGSPNRSISFSNKAAAAPPRKRTCMCSPTNHPGSFRCSLHKGNKSVPNNSQTAARGSSGRLNMRRSAMKNSLVRIGTVEGDLVKRALAALIRPSSHNQRRRGEFRPRPSRLSYMSKA